MSDQSEPSDTFVPPEPGGRSDKLMPQADIPTGSVSGQAAGSGSVSDSDPVPNRIGRYVIERVLGSGGYGRVYLAKDTQLERSVALKVPHRHRLTDPQAIDDFLAEARTLASLDYPTVVPVYDFDRWEDRCYVVSKYIDGETLTQRQRRAPITIDETVRLLHTVAQTLSYIHLQGVVHRDVKPSNLLLEENGNCFVTDFGLALRDFDIGREPGQMGTITYMSPEQARGESHLVDGRSDLFSLGVVMYEMLTGTRPFTGENWQAIIVMICYHEPRPPRQRVESIPKELERICLKLLSKRANDRYLTAQDLADDLQHYLQEAPVQPRSVSPRPSHVRTNVLESSQKLVGIVPRGLRSFDREDSLFFRDLLPGPRDRLGLPDSLRFWKRRIEANETSELFRVGVIFGPSGSGKSSFIKAGLLPILEDRLTVAFIEATSDGTEQRLLDRLRSLCPDVPPVLSLTESLSWIRNSVGRSSRSKVLIVIDQFEQWLHAWDDSAVNPPSSAKESGENADMSAVGKETREASEGAVRRAAAELAVALRQCDGEHLQAVLLVRDDFWLSISRLSDLLEVDLVPGQNLAMVDLFDKRHARKVLAEYGRGYARLPEHLGKLTKSQNAFLDQAIDGLADGEKVIPVQLAAFSEIMKGRDWDLKSLNELGGVKGVGVRFLEESFSSSGAPIHNRTHESAAQAVLRALLPDAGTNIKGAMRSESELRSVSGYETNRKMFDQLIQILDTELRLITPTDASGEESGSEKDSAGNGQRFYQLTHDFLVPAVRTWLSRRQQMTLTGRTSLRLADRAEVWTARPEKRHLPTWLEWVSFLVLTRPSQRDTSQKRMMAAASRRHSLGTVSTLIVIAALVWGGLRLSNYSRASSLTEQLATAGDQEVPGIIDQLEKIPQWSRPSLRTLLTDSESELPTRVRALLGLLRLDASNTTLFQSLEDRLFDVDFEALPAIRDEMQRSPLHKAFIERLWAIAEESSFEEDQRFRAALLLSAYDPPADDASTKRWSNIREFTAKELIAKATKFPQYYNIITDAIHPARESVLQFLREVFSSPKSEISDRQKATSLIVTLLKDSPARLADVFLDADDTQLDAFVEILDESFPEIRPVLVQAVNTSPDSEADADTQESTSNRQVNAAAMLIRHAETQGLWGLLKHRSIPNTRSGLIERVPLLNVNSELVRQQIGKESDSGIVSALLLTLGSYDTERVSGEWKAEISAVARELFRSHPAADVHSAAEWLLVRCGDEEWLELTRKELAEQPLSPDHDWSVNGHGQTFVTARDNDHHYQIATTEVTWEQYLPFRSGRQPNSDKVQYISCPVGLVTWIDAVEYCRWLTKQEGMDDADQCYPDPADLPEAEVRLHKDYRTRRGYRLPTSREWERACFGNVTTRYFFGHNERLASQYAWFIKNASGRAHRINRKKPSQLGLFGMLGNMSEWCSGSHSGPETQRNVRGAKYNAVAEDFLRLTRTGQMEWNIRYYSVGFRLARAVRSAE